MAARYNLLQVKNGQMRVEWIDAAWSTWYTLPEGDIDEFLADEYITNVEVLEVQRGRTSAAASTKIGTLQNIVALVEARRP